MKEKHEWLKRMEYNTVLGDEEYHDVHEYYQCIHCGDTKEIKE